MNCPKCGRLFSHVRVSSYQTPELETVYEGFCKVHGSVAVS